MELSFCPVCRRAEGNWWTDAVIRTVWSLWKEIFQRAISLRVLAELIRWNKWRRAVAKVHVYLKQDCPKWQSTIDDHITKIVEILFIVEKLTSEIIEKGIFFLSWIYISCYFWKARKTIVVITVIIKWNKLQINHCHWQFQMEMIRYNSVIKIIFKQQRNIIIIAITVVRIRTFLPPCKCLQCIFFFFSLVSQLFKPI